MKKLCFLAIFGLVSSFPAAAVDDVTCKKAAAKLASYVEQARTLPPAQRETFVLEQMSQEDLKTNGSKLGARATHLIDTSLNRREVTANLYGYCMTF